ncbi:MAG: hypothetical protein JOZ61_10985 [Verrucomicrobia bacterium]|nr:hypothetical protein [Verrucomicrobiota bacterium]
MPNSVPPSETVFFLDTNVFLQCKDLEQPPWHEITPAVHVRLMVPLTVCEEVDRLKNDGKDRRAKRARLASTRFAKILESPEQRTIVCAGKPTVTLEFGPNTDFGSKAFAGMDLSRPDSRIVAEALDYTFEEPERDIRLVTGDTFPKVLAKRLDLPFVAVTKEWLLKPENDPRDKQIQLLTEENERLKNVYASLALVAEDSVEIDLPRYLPLTEDEIAELLTATTESFPSETEGKDPRELHNYDGRVIGPGEFRLYDKSYSSWLANLRNFLAGIHILLNAAYQKSAVAFAFDNNGVRPIEDLLIELKAHGDLLLQHGNGEKERVLIQAPELPKLGLHGRAENRFWMPQQTAIHDYGEFHCMFSDPNPQKSLTYSWKEFFHNRNPEELVVRVAPVPDTVRGGMIECIVTARNLPKTVTARTKVSFIFHDENPSQRAAKILAAIKRRE